MKVKQIEKLLYTTCLVSFLVFLASVFFSKQSYSAPKAFQSAILNPKYKDSVFVVRIQKAGESIELRKMGKNWFIEKSSPYSLYTIADTSLAESFVNAAVKIRDMYIVDESSKNSVQLGLTDELACKISFIGEDSSILSDVYFGVSDSLKNRIVLKTSVNDKIFETKNDLSQFLTVDENYWSMSEIFGEIGDVARIEVRSKDFAKTYNTGDSSFDAVCHDLISLRHGQIANVASLAKDSEVALQISVFGGNGRVSRIFVYNDKTAENEPYRYKKVIEPAITEDEASAEGFAKENCFFEISEWTFSKIMKIFEKN